MLRVDSDSTIMQSLFNVKNELRVQTSSTLVNSETWDINGQSTILPLEGMSSGH